MPAEPVVTELAHFLSYSVDAESSAGRPIAKKFHVNGFPTLVFLSPDGSLRDILVGYRPPGPFLTQLARIRQDKGTFGALERLVGANPDDLKARYDLMVKWRDIDAKKAEKQAREIRARDPENKTWASRALHLDDLSEKLKSPTGKQAKALRAFLAKETAPDLLFRGYSSLFYGLASSIPKKGNSGRRSFLRDLVATGRNAWQHVPESVVTSFGNQLAWTIYENRTDCSPKDIAFAVDVARKAVAAAPDDVNTIDTLACCLYATGEKEEARRMVHRCLEIDPDNEAWKDRLKSFSSDV